MKWRVTQRRRLPVKALAAGEDPDDAEVGAPMAPVQVYVSAANLEGATRLGLIQIEAHHVAQEALALQTQRKYDRGVELELLVRREP